MGTIQTKYRPKKWSQFIGNASLKRSIRTSLEGKDGGGGAYLLLGPAGVGKTTLARLIAKELGCTGSRLIEVDAATHSGVEQARALASIFDYRVPARKNRVVVVDECHALTKQAWQALLKSVEEPGPGGYWIFCTTEPTKVPKTIVSRCLTYTLQRPTHAELRGLVQRVLAKEKQTLSEDLVDFILEESDGLPRRALSLVGTILGGDLSEEEARDVLGATVAQDAVRGLCLALDAAEPRWPEIRKHLLELKGASNEGVRRRVLFFFTGKLLSARSVDSSSRAVLAVEAFSEPIPDGENTLSPIVLAVLRSIL